MISRFKLNNAQMLELMTTTHSPLKRNNVPFIPDSKMPRMTPDTCPYPQQVQHSSPWLQFTRCLVQNTLCFTCRSCVILITSFELLMVAVRIFASRCGVLPSNPFPASFLHTTPMVNIPDYHPQNQ